MAYYSWNETLLPVQGLPKIPSSSGGYYYANYLVYSYGGVVYAVGLDWVGGYLFRATEDKKSFWLYRDGYRWTLADGKWTNQETARMYVEDEDGKWQNAYPVDEFIWTSQTVYSWSNPPGIFSKETVLKESTFSSESEIGKPISEYTLEPLPEKRVVVSSWGNTGVIIGAQLRGYDEVIDVSNLATYTFFGLEPVDAYRDNAGQLIVDPKYPLDEIQVNILFEGHVAFINVFNASGNDSGGSGGDSGDSGDSGESSAITGITASRTVLELSPGASCPFTVTVDGTGDYDPTVLYHVFENENGIYWDGNTIYIGEDASLIDCYIVFYSQQDPSYNIEVLITVSIPEGTDLKPCYLKENGEWVKKTVYERINGEWVKISDASQQTQEPSNIGLICIDMKHGINIGTGGSAYNPAYGGGTFENGKFILNGKGYLTIPADFMNVSAETPWTVAFTIDTYTKGSSSYGRFARGNNDVPSIYYSKAVSGARIKLANGNVNSNTTGATIVDESYCSVSSSKEVYIEIPTDTPTTFVFRNNGEYISLWVDGSEKLRQTASSYTSSYRASQFSIGDDAGGSYYLSHLECSMLKAWDYALSDEEIAVL